MATLDAAYQAARELQADCLPGYEYHEQPSLLLALWASACSIQTDLAPNGRQADALRPYVAQGLPEDKAAVAAILRAGYGGLVNVKARACLRLQDLYRAGKLARFETMPTTYRAWHAWRRDIVKTCKGCGISYKTASFAALIMWPLDCPLVPVDRHVIARLAGPVTDREKMDRLPLYRSYERRVAHEWVAAGKPHSIAVWHWYKWEDWRQGTARGTVADSCESHLLLSAHAW